MARDNTNIYQKRLKRHAFLLAVGTCVFFACILAWNLAGSKKQEVIRTIVSNNFASDYDNISIHFDLAIFPIVIGVFCFLYTRFEKSRAAKNRILYLRAPRRIFVSLGISILFLLLWHLPVAGGLQALSLIIFFVVTIACIEAIVSSISVYPDKLVLKRYFKTRVISFADIDRVKFVPLNEDEYGTACINVKLYLRSTECILISRFNKLDKMSRYFIDTKKVNVHFREYIKCYTGNSRRIYYSLFFMATMILLAYLVSFPETREYIAQSIYQGNIELFPKVPPEGID